MEFQDALESVNDFSTFLVFAKILRDDRTRAVAMERDAPSAQWSSEQGWESTTIEMFLDGGIAWAEATRCGETQGISTDNPWKQFAAFLYCGKIYE